MLQTRKIILEDGRVFHGYAFGGAGRRIAEVVFNTSPVGYQEILSDPSYTDQAVVMTYPLIGNYGMAPEDYETAVPTIGALIVREYTEIPSHYRSTASLGEVMKAFGIPGVYGVDTRSLARSIRNGGSRRALIAGEEVSAEEALFLLRTAPRPADAVARVSRRQNEVFPAENARFHVVAIDCGMKRNIVRCLTRRGCRVTAVPWNTSAEDILRLHPDGLIVSNGPGDPTDVPATIRTVGALRGKCPIFGICLGHQIIALSYGAKTYKLKFGHRGGNHPVRDIATGRIEITSQNHSYAVDPASLAQTPLTVTRVNLLDGTVEGLACEKDGVFSVQYHPESAPGPQDSTGLFDRFIRLMEERTHA